MGGSAYAINVSWQRRYKVAMSWCARPLPVMSLATLAAVVLTLSLSLVFLESLVAFGAISLLLVFRLRIYIRLALASWIGILVFLVYLGGLMVVFAYFLAICPNQKIEFKWGVRTWLMVFGGVFGLVCWGGWEVWSHWVRERG